MGVRGWGGNPAARGTHEQALLYQVRLVHVLYRFGGFAHGDREGGETDRAAAESFTDTLDHSSARLVETKLVDTKERETIGRDTSVDVAIAFDLGIVANLAEQTVCNTRRASGAAGDLIGAALIDVDIKNSRSSQRDRLQIIDLVVVETSDQPEPITKRAGDQTGTRGGTNQREPSEIERNRPCRRTLAENDVNPEILHSWIQHLFDRAGETVNLVDKQHIAVFELRQDRRQIASPFQSWAGRDLEVGAHLRRDDVGKRRLTEARRPGEQQMVSRFAPAISGAEHHAKMALQFLLADKIGERTGPKPRLVEQDSNVIGLFRRREQLFAGHRESLADLRAQTPDASRRSASFNRSLDSPSAGRSNRTA